ncbi:hypothetical protein [Salicola sp. Rm-C-2C1-2]|uniref:hypothetical protein n=1 Tax=Salicola sp. Rm-C-2C1-2 TaxID=3141321 RepID=UPI0032E4D789
MAIVTTIGLLVLIGVGGWSLYRVREQRRRIEHALARVADPDVPPPEMLMTVRVLNPIEVARRESTSARLVGDYMPETVRRIVFRQLTTELDEALSERGIESEISVEYR